MFGRLILGAIDFRLALFAATTNHGFVQIIIIIIRQPHHLRLNNDEMHPWKDGSSYVPKTWTQTANNNKATTATTRRNKTKKQSYQKYIATLSTDHPLRLGVTQKQRSTEFIHAAEGGECHPVGIIAGGWCRCECC